MSLGTPAEIAFEALLGAVGLSIDFASPPNKVDLVGEQGIGTGVPNICIVHVRAQQPGKGSLVSGSINCNGDENVFIKFNPTVDDVIEIGDDRIGSVKLHFFKSNSGTDAPWPGGPAIEQSVWTSTANLQTSNTVGLSTLAPDTGEAQGYVSGKDCDGNTLLIKAGVHFPAQKDTDPDEYAIGFPFIGKAVGCPSKKDKRDDTRDLDIWEGLADTEKREEKRGVAFTA